MNSPISCMNKVMNDDNARTAPCTHKLNTTEICDIFIV